MCQLGTTCIIMCLSRISGNSFILHTHISYFVSYPSPAILLEKLDLKPDNQQLPLNQEVKGIFEAKMPL